MPTKIAINGFGRIGRPTLRRIIDNHPDLEVVAINDLSEPETLVHLLKYDSVYGVYEKEVSLEGQDLIIEGKPKIKIFAEKEPEKLPWKEMGIDIIIDVAASQFSEEKNKIYNIDYFQRLVNKYPIIALEDPFSEDDWSGFRQITEKLGEKITIIGDDLLVTNPEKIKQAQEEKACNGLLLKINQIGNVTKALESAKLAKSFGWKIMVSHRSGETNDDFIADFAVGIGADFIKTGAPARGERVAKYNRLLEIKEEIF